MSRLVLIRHAQASFSSDPERAFQDYDRLSELGRRQAEALGEELVAADVAFDRVYSGPAVRHQETTESVASAFARLARPWPEPVTVEELGEHQGARVVRRALDLPKYREVRALLEAGIGGGSVDPELRRAYLIVFRRVTREWARGELSFGSDEESWRSFRGRVEAGVRRILSEAGRGATVGVFTSGGPIGSTVAWALGLGDEQALELAWIVENATITELLFNGDRVSLKSFNVQPRLSARELITHV
jgi:broad specificity phosphatase PhoE